MTSFIALRQAVQGVTSCLSIKQLLSIGLAVIFTFLLAWYFLLHPPISVSTKDGVRNLIVSGVRNASELTTAETTIKATVVLKEEAKALNIIPVGETNLVYEGVGTVRAGLNLRKIEVIELDNNQGSIRLLLPAPHISSVSLDVNRSSTLANYRKWFGHEAGPELYDQAQRKAIAQIKDEACANQILDVADENAQSLVEGILTKVGFHSIYFDTQEVSDCPVI